MLLRLDASHSYSIHLLVFIFSTSLPFQLLCQGVEDVAVCVLALIESLFFYDMVTIATIGATNSIVLLWLSCTF